MPEFDLVIKNGTVVNANGSARMDVGVRGETIAELGQGLSGRREIDAAGMLVTPGAVDIHVHMELDFGGELRSSDDFFTGTRAAALGGTTCIGDFVEAGGEERLLDALAIRRKAADECSTIDYALHMTIGPHDIAKLDQVPEVVDAGVTSFKLYMAYGHRLDDGQLLLALEAVRDAGGFPVVHAENWDVITTLIRRNLALGRTGPEWHPRSRPAILEGEAAGRLIDIAAYLEMPVHIFHVSCEAVVERIRAARARGLRVTGETCPQYLFLTEEAYDAPGDRGLLPVCSPPLRPQADQDALWTALAHGDLEVVTTDHCPFTLEDKRRGIGDFSKIPGGVPSIEMRFAALYSKGVRNGLFSENRWVELCCTKPAELVGLEKKGRIEPGFDADLVVFDPNKTKTISTKTLHEQVDWTPYEGLEIQGWPNMTISRGEVIVEKGRCIGEMGRGRFLKRG